MGMPSASISVFDAHVDSLQRALDLGHDLGQQGPGQLDLVRGRAGGLGTVVLVAWVDPKYLQAGPGGGRSRTEALLDAFDHLVAAHPEEVRAVTDGASLDAAHEAGCIAAIAGIEGGHSIEGSLETLAHFARRGVRMMTLVWNNHLPWIRSCQGGAGSDIPTGLSDFGREVVRCMNQNGMVVDVSHASKEAFYDVLECSSEPIVASHSGCASLNDHPRNLDDDQLRALAAAGGVVGIVFCTSFLNARAGQLEHAERQSRAYQALQHTHETGLFHLQADHLQEVLPPLVLDQVVQHILHAIAIAGPEHVGIGSDFDGIQRRPAGLEDAACYPNLCAALLQAGLPESSVRAVMGGNMTRVFRQCTKRSPASLTRSDL